MAVVDVEQAVGPLGFITERDIARAVAGGNDLNEIRIRALMSKSPERVPGSARQRIAAWCSPPPWRPGYSEHRTAEVAVGVPAEE